MSERRPWWHTSRTPGGSLGIAALGALAATFAWWNYALTPRGFQAIAASVWTLQALVYSLSALARVRQGEPIRSRHGHGAWRNL